MERERLTDSVDYIVLYARDLETSVAFYRDVVGLAVKLEGDGYVEFVGPPIGKTHRQARHVSIRETWRSSKRFRAPLVVAAVVAVVILAFLYLMQRSMIYFPGSAVSSAERLPPGAETIQLHTNDGLRLAAWFLPATGVPIPAGAEPRPGPAVLIFNGNAGDRSHRLPLATALTERGYAVLLFDYRGYAGNPGSPSEDGLRADARAAMQALAGRPEVDAERIAYFGESLGAAVAGGLATERPPAALVLRSPPPSIAEMGRHHFPYLPVLDAFLLDRFALAEQLRGVRVPLLVLVTERDEIVPAGLSRRVFDAATEPKRYVTLAAAHHNDPALLVGEELLTAVASFLDEWLDGRLAN